MYEDVEITDRPAQQTELKGYSTAQYKRVQIEFINEKIHKSPRSLVPYVENRVIKQSFHSYVFSIE